MTRSVRALALLLALVACDGGTPTSHPSGSSPVPSISVSPGVIPVIAAAGDIACNPRELESTSRSHNPEACHQRSTAALLAAGRYTAVLALGDNQYEAGALADYRAVYDDAWGRFKPITYPVPGNHDYGTGRAAGYFAYFGSRAGSHIRGYYSFDIGTWHLVALNSNCSAVGGCGESSPQGRWLRADLAAHRNTCTLAYWHHPMFSSGLHGNDPSYAGFWRLLYAAGADVVLVAHDHLYERFAPQRPDARADATRGIREFVVGTGGRSRYPFTTIRANSQMRNNKTFGVLALTLRPTGYDWRFVPEAGQSFSDSGSASCH